MNKETASLVQRLSCLHELSEAEYRCLVDGFTPELAEYAASLAVKARQAVYGNKVFIRGLIEITNACRNDCLYCGIRRSNRHCQRYRLSPQEILQCCDEGYELGFRTFVLQGGEDGFFTDDLLCELLQGLKSRYPLCAVTLSLGERPRESYARLREAGADRYLLRHETADREHYAKLHPHSMRFETRMRCLNDLKELGYQVGCGFMVGSPHQTSAELAKDLKFVEQFSPDMCGIGPFIPQADTPFGREKAGTAELTCYLLSLLRLIKPNLLLPSTTALGTIHPHGRELGILAGANVVMPNLSPPSVRKKYALYDNKLSDGSESAQCKAELVARMASIGYEIVTDRGDIQK
ncbi:MAG: [Clostridia bacterium]|nr:[FeFe] hydrogenase H-cluster radical SAM maturase HydE [Clostridia bacterium]